MKIKDFIGEKATYDDAGQMIWGVDKEGSHQLLLELSVRGWGALSSQFLREGKPEAEAAKFQDELGQWITDAINEKLKREI